MTIERMAWAMAGIMQIFALSILCFALFGFRITWWGIVGGALVAIAMTVGVVRLARQKNREDNERVTR